MSVLLFVYGTLKIGFTRNYALHGQTYLGTAKTKPEYSMHATGGYPALINKKLAEQNNIKADKSVYGEIWEVDDDCLVRLDKIEGVEVTLFERSTINIEEFTLSRLPIDKTVWNDVQENRAHAYLYKQPINGAACCGSFWHRK